MLRIGPRLVLLVGLLFAPCAAIAGDGPVVGKNADRALTLRELLEKELRAARPGELAFIRRVVARVEEKKIPLKTVLITYRWAMKKPRRPYVYFEKAMKEHAERLGVDLTSPAEKELQGALRVFLRNVRVVVDRFTVRF